MKLSHEKTTMLDQLLSKVATLDPVPFIKSIVASYADEHRQTITIAINDLNAAHLDCLAEYVAEKVLRIPDDPNGLNAAEAVHAFAEHYAAQVHAQLPSLDLKSLYGDFCIVAALAQVSHTAAIHRYLDKKYLVA